VVPKFDDQGNYIGNSTTSYQINSTVVRCGGYKQGLCRPIVNAAWGSGLNSACMCNPGFNGPSCSNQTSLWWAGSICGPDGESVLQRAGSPRLGSSGSDDEDYFLRYVVPMNDQASLNSNMYSAYKCQCKAPMAAKGYVPNANGICGRGCRASDLLGANNLTCSGNGKCIDDPRAGSAATPGKVCSCDLGWDGMNCANPNLRDTLYVNATTKLGQVCGGAMDAEGEDGVTPRGVIVYQDSTNLTQKCQCTYPYKPDPSALSPSVALCWRDCFNNCTDALHGACVKNVTTGNDNNCICASGAFTGQDCSKKLLAVYSTQSGSQLACTGHGIPSPTNQGYCICDEDYEGIGCETYKPNRQCGTGQTVFSADSLGIIVS